MLTSEEKSLKKTIPEKERRSDTFISRVFKRLNGLKWQRKWREREAKFCEPIARWLFTIKILRRAHKSKVFGGKIALKAKSITDYLPKISSIIH